MSSAGMKYFRVRAVVNTGLNTKAVTVMMINKSGVTTKSFNSIIPALHFELDCAIYIILPRSLKLFGRVNSDNSFLDNRKHRNILFIVPYPENIAPGQRFRFEHFMPVLKSANLTFQIRPFIQQSAYSILFSKGNYLRKVMAVLAGFIRRIFHLFEAMRYDYVYIYREATPIGPPWWEWMAHLAGVKIIYDFDDAIWMKDDHEKKFPGSLKWKQKTGKICTWSHRIAAGNDYLAAYARQFNSSTIVLPTVVDTSYHHPETNKTSPLTIGWTGSHSTLPYLIPLIPILRQIRQDMEFRFLIIADQDPNYSDHFIEFRKWNIDHEISDLNEMDIGVMPLTDTKWAKGKCGFKIIQYLALEIPAAASDVGINAEIVRNGGFVCRTDEEWHQALRKLLSDPELRRQRGIAGRKFIMEHYSVQAVQDIFLSLFTD